MHTLPLKDDYVHLTVKVDQQNRQWALLSVCAWIATLHQHRETLGLAAYLRSCPALRACILVELLSRKPMVLGLLRKGVSGVLL